MPANRVIIVGGGLSGLACAMRLAEEGVAVDLFSMVPVTQSHSVCAQGGINACNDIARQRGDSEWLHFDETVIGGDFLADQPPVHEMCMWAPRIVHLLDRMGVPFQRTGEGQLALRRASGSLFARTVFAGATTGQQVLYALDQQVRRHEADGHVRKFEYWEFLAPVIHDDICVGIIAQDLRSMRIESFSADAVVIAAGGNGQIFANNTMSLACTGSAASRCFQAGAKYANPEFIQFHPTAIPPTSTVGEKWRIVSESVRGEGARLWVPATWDNGSWKPHPNAARGPAAIPESERYYFLEDRHPKYGNLVPGDIAARQITQMCADGFGVAGGNSVYLDLRDAAAEHGRQTILTRLTGALEIYRRFAGADPLEEPMRVYPAVHASMGGLWVGFKKDEKTGGLRAGDPANLCTNLPGLYALGQANFAYHGANALGGNDMLSCIFDGLFGAPCIKSYCTDIDAAPPPPSAYQATLKKESDRTDALLANHGDETPHLLREELGRWMTDHCTVVRHNDKLEQTLAQCQQWKARCQKLKLSDTTAWANQSISFARCTRDMIVMSEAILKGALLRNESRGAHYKPAYPERDDVNFLKATIARYEPNHNTTFISYEPVDTSLIAPRLRNYGAKSPAPAAKAEKPVAV